MRFTIKAEPLQELARDIFAAAGTPDDIAALVAESLVTTNLLGHDSHGVLRVKQYISMIRKGMIKPAERPRIRKRFGATAMVTLGYGFGQIGARYAAELAIVISREHGIAAVSLGQSTHVGRLGEWTGMIAAQGLIGIGFAGGVLLPMGLHKGSGLSLMMEIIPNLLAGDHPMSSPEFHFGNPMLLLALLPEAFDEGTDFAAHVDALKTRVKAVKPAEGFDEVLTPGEPEARSYAERVKYGIPLPERVWADLCGLADELGVCVPSPDA